MNNIFTFRSVTLKVVVVCMVMAFNVAVAEGDKKEVKPPVRKTEQDLEESVAKILDENRDAIIENRTAAVELHLKPGASAKVTQVKHDFWFGSAISRNVFKDNDKSKHAISDKDKAMYKKIAKANFNSAVHENALKWQCTETKKGKVDYSLTDKVADWCIDNGMRIRGHTVFYPAEKYIQKWVKDLSDDELRETLEKRAASVMTHFKGRITEYDVNNEMLEPKTYFKGRLGGDIQPQMFKWCNKADPDATLYVNDNRIFFWRGHPGYIKQIKDLQKQGAPVGGIGIQGHFFQPSLFDSKFVRDVLDNLGALGLPIKITEFDVSTTDEIAKAEVLANVYAICFSHPAVEGILMWGFWEGRHWRPTAALWKKDWTPTLAAETYRRLVYKEWWTNWTGKADKEGRADLRAFFGEQKVEVNGKSRVFYISPSEKSVVIDCSKSNPAKWVKRSQSVVGSAVNLSGLR